MPQCQLRNISPIAGGESWQSGTALRIGRQEGFEVLLNEISVSRRHAELVVGKQGWVVRDLGSTNGTYLNGSRVGRVEQKVRDGDILQCGDILLAVKLTPENAAESAFTEHPVRVRLAVRQSWDQVGDWTAREAARAAEAPARLRALLQVGRDYRKVISLEDYLESVLWQTAECLDAWTGCILLRDSATRQIGTRAVFNPGEEAGVRAWHRSDMVKQALERSESLLCERLAESGKREGPGSFVLAQLRTQDRTLGLICLARGADQPPFEEADLRLADALALSAATPIGTIEQLLEAKRNVVLQTLTVLTQLIRLRDEYTGRHNQRVTDYAVLIAEELKLPSWECQLLRLGTPLLDIGKVGIRDAQLSKPGPLTAEEVKLMQTHPLKGSALLEAIPELGPLLPVVRNHHEHWDGSGYPDGLQGKAIPLLARIVAVADALDAMTSERPYRGPFSLDEAFAEIQRNAGTQFDPDCVTALLRVRPKIERAHDQHEGLMQTISLAEIQRTRKGLDLGELRRKYQAL